MEFSAEKPQKFLSIIRWTLCWFIAAAEFQIIFDSTSSYSTTNNLFKIKRQLDRRLGGLSDVLDAFTAVLHLHVIAL